MDELPGEFEWADGLSPWYLVATLGSFALLAGAARLVMWWLRPGADAFWLWAVLGGVLLLRTLLFMGAVAVRGPGGSGSGSGSTPGSARSM